MQKKTENFFFKSECINLQITKRKQTNDNLTIQAFPEKTFSILFMHLEKKDPSGFRALALRIQKHVLYCVTHCQNSL